MKKLAGLIVLSLLLAFVTPQPVAAQKEPEKKEIFALSRHIVAPTVLENVDVKVKKLKNGIRIAMKSKDAEKIQNLKSIVEQCLKDAAALTSDDLFRHELLYRKGVTTVVSDIKKGFQLEMTSEDKEMVKLLQNVYLPIQKKPRRIISAPEGTGGRIMTGEEEEM